MSKAAEAFRTISEIADELDVPKHVLRFWELKFPQLKPMKRGGGRRYYRPEDVALLRGIRHLLHADGYTIKGVQKILREQGVEAAKEAGQAANDQLAPSASKKRTTARGVSRTPSTATKATVRTRAKTSGKNIEKVSGALESAINELRVCRDLLRQKTDPASAEAKPRKAAAKPARKRARARAVR